MDKERFLASGLIEQYVLGLTTPEETQEVERYAHAFPEIKEEINALRRSIEQYAAQYAVPPPAHLKGKILSEIASSKSTSGKKVDLMPAVLKRARVQFVALLLVAVGAIVWLLYKQSQLQNEYQQLSSEFSALRTQCESLQQQHEATQQVVAFVQGSATQVIHLQGTALSPDAHAIVYWNEKTQIAYLSIDKMPPLPPGKQYQIWADVEGEMIHSGLLVADTETWQPIKVIEKAESLNITIEPEGGSEHPTVAMLVANGNIQTI